MGGDESKIVEIVDRLEKEICDKATNCISDYL